MSLVFKHIASDEELENLKKSWKELDESSQHHNICSSYEWVYNWWTVFKNIENNKIGYKKELIIVCAYYDNKLVLVCPLMKLRRKKIGLSISFVEFVGQQWSGIYYDIVADVQFKIKLNEIQEYLNKNLKFDILYLRYIPEESSHFKNENLFLFAKCPEVKIKEFESFDFYSKSNYSKGHKQNLRTGRNRAINNKDTLEEVVEPMTENNFKSVILLSKSKLVDSKSWLYGDENKLDFYKRIHDQFESNVIIVKINGKDVAYRTNVIFNKLKLCLDASYDRNTPKYELGALSVNKNIQDSFSKGLVAHSLGPGLDPYKLKFTKSFKNLYAMISRGNTIKSFVISPIFKYIIKK